MQPDDPGVRFAWLFCCLLLPVLRAEWKDLREGMAAGPVVEAVGQPLIRMRARQGLFETWSYDLGGEVRFVRGRVVSWQAPRG